MQAISLKEDNTESEQIDMREHIRQNQLVLRDLTRKVHELSRVSGQGFRRVFASGGRLPHSHIFSSSPKVWRRDEWRFIFAFYTRGRIK